MCSNQKAHCERNHEYIRKVLPKKSSFDSLTCYDIRKLCWHINSTKRASLNGQFPIKLASLLLPKEIFEALDLREIPCNEINLTPTLLKKSIKQLKLRTVPNLKYPSIPACGS